MTLSFHICPSYLNFFLSVCRSTVRAFTIDALAMITGQNFMEIRQRHEERYRTFDKRPLTRDETSDVLEDFRSIFNLAIILLQLHRKAHAEFITSISESGLAVKLLRHQGATAQKKGSHSSDDDVSISPEYRPAIKQKRREEPAADNGRVKRSGGPIDGPQIFKRARLALREESDECMLGS